MNLINQLLQLEGRYSGRGKNYESAIFEASFIIKPIVDGAGINISYTATAHGDQILHHENTIIAPNEDKSLSLWTLNSNVPFLYEHKYKPKDNIPSQATSIFTFQYNDPIENNKFREEISLTIWENLELSYDYSWGLPRSEYGPKSSALLKKIS